MGVSRYVHLTQLTLENRMLQQTVCEVHRAEHLFECQSALNGEMNTQEHSYTLKRQRSALHEQGRHYGREVLN